MANLGARVIMEVPRALKSILAELDGVADWVVVGETLPEFHYHCPLMSLPLALKTTMSTIPAQIPYLKSNEMKVAYWGEKLGKKNKPRVGLVWSGGFKSNQPEFWSANRRRNVPLAKFAILGHPGIDFFSLQKGQPAESELTELITRNWTGPHIDDFTNLLIDFSDTAALIEHLDMVISVDTSTAHLAGALGKPVWILNRLDSCWRWLMNRVDSPWYPTVRLYRQETVGEWDSVLNRMSKDLFQILT